ncbi:MAG: glycosyltransferase [Parasutterella excrementihominis]|uniref:glycosyltransferase n=1 Tax=Parasutterella TaxID=577310 RepID=UPI0039A19467
MLASTYEPFGLVPIESLCMGVPVVISENLGCKDYISPEVKEEFNPFSIGSLDVSIRNCLKHKSSMQERAKELPSEKFLVDFSLKKHIKKLIQVCELARKENAN